MAHEDYPLRRLKPWQLLSAVTCERCDRQAISRVTAGAATLDPNMPTIWLGSDPATASVLTCAEHEEQVADELLDRYDGSAVDPLRDPWLYWFRCTKIGRPLDLLLLKLDEHRWNRALACPHTPEYHQQRKDGDAYCEKCGLESLRLDPEDKQR